MDKCKCKILVLFLTVFLVFLLAGCDNIVPGRTSEETAETSEPVENYTQGTVEGREWIGPLHYHIRGLPLGPIAVENYNLHRYDTGKFFGPGTFQIWGEAYNNAYDLADSDEYSFGVMTLRILIRYEDTAGNIKTLIDSSVEDEHGQLVAPRFDPGSMEFAIQ